MDSIKLSNAQVRALNKVIDAEDPTQVTVETTNLNNGTTIAVTYIFSSVSSPTITLIDVDGVRMELMQ